MTRDSASNVRPFRLPLDDTLPHRYIVHATPEHAMMTESEYFALLTPEMRLKYIGQRVAIIRRNLEEFAATYAGMQGDYAKGKVDGLKRALIYLDMLSAVEARPGERLMAEAP